MRAKVIDLLKSTGSTYAPDRTSLLGNMAIREVNGQQVISSPAHLYTDVFTDTTGLLPGGPIHYTPNNRKFVLSTAAAIVAAGFPVSTGCQVALYDLHPTTKKATYVGKIQFLLPNTAATAHTITGFRVIDTGTTGWKILAVTKGAVLINGGLFVVNKVDRTDFAQVGIPTFLPAKTDDEKAVYFAQDPAGMGAANNMTVGNGCFLHPTDPHIYIHNGVSAAHQYFAFNYSATPTIDVSREATLTNTSPGVANFVNPHGLAVGDQVVFYPKPGAVLPALIVLNTPYFVLAAGFGPNAFQVSGTTGGAAIAFTGSSGTFVVQRAWGMTSALFSHKTGNLTALSGTTLSNNSESRCVPKHTTLANENCVFIATTTNLYLGKISELTAGATSWPSLVTANVLGGPTDVTAITVTMAGWSDECDCAVFLTNTAVLIAKKMINNQLIGVFGSLSNMYFETLNRQYFPFGLSAISNMEIRDGWIFMTGLSTVIGQRITMKMHLFSDAAFGGSILVTPVMKLDRPLHLLSVAPLEVDFDETSGSVIMYRTENFSSDDMDGPEWSEVFEATDLGGVPLSSDEIQFQIRPALMNPMSLPPAQIQGFEVNYHSDIEVSEKWAASSEHTTRDGESPSYTVFKLRKVYETAIPKLYFKSYDTTNSPVAQANTVSNANVFSYSADDGQSWTVLTGHTIPNVAGTLLRYHWTDAITSEVISALTEEV